MPGTDEQQPRIVLVCGPPGTGKERWAKKKYSRWRFVDPQLFFAKQPDAGLRKLARFVSAEARRSDHGCVIIDNDGNQNFLTKMFEVLSKLAPNARNECVAVLPRTGMRQCLWQLALRKHKSEADVLTALCNWYVEPVTAKPPEPESFDEFQQVHLPEPSTSSGPTILFYDWRQWYDGDVRKVLQSFDHSVALVTKDDRDLLRDNLSSLPAGQYFSFGSDSFLSIPGGISSEESAFAVACGALGARPVDCRLFDENGYLRALPIVSPDAAEFTREIPSGEFIFHYEFKLMFGRTSALPSSRDKQAEEETANHSEILSDDEIGEVCLVEEEEMAKHVRWMYGILSNAETVVISNLSISKRTASGTAAGSNKNSYPVTVEVESGAVTASSCTCPFFSQTAKGKGCKHVIALILAARSTITDSRRKLIQETRFPARRDRTKDDGGQGPRSLPNWASGEPAEMDAGATRRSTARKKRTTQTHVQPKIRQSKRRRPQRQLSESSEESSPSVSEVADVEQKVTSTDRSQPPPLPRESGSSSELQAENHETGTLEAAETEIVAEKAHSRSAAVQATSPLPAAPPTQESKPAEKSFASKMLFDDSSSDEGKPAAREAPAPQQTIRHEPEPKGQPEPKKPKKSYKALAAKLFD